MTQPEYEIKRNELIPDAERMAYKLAGARPLAAGGKAFDKWAAYWNRYFHYEMNKLATKEGLC